MEGRDPVRRSLSVAAATGGRSRSAIPSPRSEARIGGRGSGDHRPLRTPRRPSDHASAPKERTPSIALPTWNGCVTLSTLSHRPWHPRMHCVLSLTESENAFHAARRSRWCPSPGIQDTSARIWLPSLASRPRSCAREACQQLQTQPPNLATAGGSASRMFVTCPMTRGRVCRESVRMSWLLCPMQSDRDASIRGCP